MAGAYKRNILVCGDTRSGVNPAIAESVAESARKKGHAVFPVDGLTNGFKHTRGDSLGVVFLITNNLQTRMRRRPSPAEAAAPENFDVLRYLAGIAAWNRSIDQKEDPVLDASRVNNIFIMTQSADPLPGFDPANLYRVPSRITLGQQRSFAALRASQMLATLPEPPRLELVTMEPVVQAPPVVAVPAEALVA